MKCLANFANLLTEEKKFAWHSIHRDKALNDEGPAKVNYHAPLLSAPIIKRHDLTSLENGGGGGSIVQKFLQSWPESSLKPGSFLVISPPFKMV
jgi:hypothetical protein